MAMCILAALHAPDDADGVPALVGAMYIADGLTDIRALRMAYTE